MAFVVFHPVPTNNQGGVIRRVHYFCWRRLLYCNKTWSLPQKKKMLKLHCCKFRLRISFVAAEYNENQIQSIDDLLLSEKYFSRKKNRFINCPRIKKTESQFLNRCFFFSQKSTVVQSPAITIIQR